MRYIDQDAQPAPPGATRGEELERKELVRPERRRLYPPDAPPAEWEDEWVDLGGEA